MSKTQVKPVFVDFLEELRGSKEVNETRLMDHLSEALAAEEGSLEMYSEYAVNTNDLALQRKLEEFREQTEKHVQILRRVITALGGDPDCKSESARAMQLKAQGLMEIELAGEANDISHLKNLLTVESLCQLNWQILKKLSLRIKESHITRILQDAVKMVESDEDEHVEWLRMMLEDRAYEALLKH